MKHLIFIIVSVLCFWCSSVYADDNKIIIRSEGIGGYAIIGAAQAEIVSPEGVRILIDVSIPDNLSSPAVSNDILLTTHFHYDHYNQDFIGNFPGKKLIVKAGTLKVKDVEIISIPASHYADTNFADSFGSDYIFLIIIGGGKFRIAHFGDIGQDALTPGQLSVLGKVDVVFMQLDNSYSSMNMQNLKAFNLMDQVKPKMVIPTHFTDDSAEYAVKKWKGIYTTKTEIKVGPEDLNGDTKFILMGFPAGEYGKKFNLIEFK